jgi:hypothetical protein
MGLNIGDEVETLDGTKRGKVMARSLYLDDAVWVHQKWENAAGSTDFLRFEDELKLVSE